MPDIKLRGGVWVKIVNGRIHKVIPSEREEGRKKYPWVSACYPGLEWTDDGIFNIENTETKLNVAEIIDDNPIEIEAEEPFPTLPMRCAETLRPIRWVKRKSDDELIREEFSVFEWSGEDVIVSQKGLADYIRKNRGK